jgi:hypothetical protein
MISLQEYPFLTYCTMLWKDNMAILPVFLSYSEKKINFSFSLSISSTLVLTNIQGCTLSLNLLPLACSYVSIVWLTSMHTEFIQFLFFFSSSQLPELPFEFILKFSFLNKIKISKRGPLISPVSCWIHKLFLRIPGNIGTKVKIVTRIR